MIKVGEVYRDFRNSRGCGYNAFFKIMDFCDNYIILSGEIPYVKITYSVFLENFTSLPVTPLEIELL